MGKRILPCVAVCALLLSMFAFTACGASANGTDTLSILADESVYGAMRGLVEDFAEQNGLRLELQLLPTPENTEQAIEREAAMTAARLAITSGKGPDMYLLADKNTPYGQAFFTDVYKGVRAGAFLGLDYLFESGMLNSEDFFAPVLAAGQLDGTQYFLPLGMYMEGFAVERVAAQGAGLLDEGAACEEWLARVCALAQQRENETGAPSLCFYSISPMLLAQPPFLDYEDNRANVNTAFARRLFALQVANTDEARAALYYDHAFFAARDGRATEVEQALLLLAAGGHNDIAIDKALQKAGRQAVFAPVPAQVAGVAVQASCCIGLNPAGQNLAAAQRLLVYLMGEEAQGGTGAGGCSAVGGLPVNRMAVSAYLEAMEYSPVYIQSVLDACERVVHAQVVGTEVYTMCNDAMRDVMDGTKTLDAALASLESRLQRWLEE